MIGVYMCHITPPFGHASHYVGCSSKSIENRIEVHFSGQGVPLIRHALEAGHSVQLVRVWEGKGFEFEQHLKHSYKNAPKLCPICNPKMAQYLYNSGE